MWMFSCEGFFSVVAVNLARVQVRARRRADLVNLRKFGLRGRILSTPHADYPFRVIITKTLWTKIAAQMSSGINYDNFKNEVKRIDKNRADIYTDVWRVLLALEKKTPGRFSSVDGD